MKNLVARNLSEALANVHVLSVPVDEIVVKRERMRAINKEKLKEMTEDIKRCGGKPLQPIGVREWPPAQLEESTPGVSLKTDLVFGLHRFNAVKALGVRDIPCMVFPHWMSDDACRLAEISENLKRAELSDDEKAIHTARYAELLKRIGVVQSARSKQNKARSRSGVQSLHAGLDEKPTVTEKLAKDSGVKRRAVYDRFEKVKALAASEGVKTDARSFEEITPEQLLEVSEAATKAAEKRKDAPKKKDQTVVVKMGGKVKAKKTNDPTADKLSAIWKKYGGHELTRASLPKLMADIYALANIATLTVAHETWEILCNKQPTEDR